MPRRCKPIRTCRRRRPRCGRRRKISTRSAASCLPTVDANASADASAILAGDLRPARSAVHFQSVSGDGERLLCARRVRRPAPADRGQRGAGRVSALRARSDLSDADLQRGDGGHCRKPRCAARSRRRSTSSRSETEQLDVVRNQFDVGAATRTDVLTQQSEVATAQATLPPLQKQLEQQRHVLLALIGRFPNESARDHLTLASLRLPTDLPLSLPSQLVEQRPDVRAAEAQLHQASAQIGVAIANAAAAIQPHRASTAAPALTAGGAVHARRRRSGASRRAARSRFSTASRCCIRNAPPKPPTTWPTRNTATPCWRRSRTSPTRCARCSWMPRRSKRNSARCAPRPTRSIWRAASIGSAPSPM